MGRIDNRAILVGGLWARPGAMCSGLSPPGLPSWRAASFWAWWPLVGPPGFSPVRLGPLPCTSACAIQLVSILDCSASGPVAPSLPVVLLTYPLSLLPGLI